jgi:superfamily II DNA helicase RecQ
MSELYRLRDFACPLVLLTATLPPRESNKLETILRIEKGSTTPRYLRQRTTRRNIEYGVRTLANTDDCLAQLVADIELDSHSLEDPGARAIVYSRTHIDAERVGRRLKCGVYHGGLKEGTKMKAFTTWGKGGPGISKFISATSGLGVGIDIPGVRTVYHFHESQDFLGFVQESGRAGRDGHPAKSKVYLDTTSLQRLDKLRQKWHLTPQEQAILEYHSPGFCRRSQMSFYVDGESEWCAKDPELISCDLCKDLMSQARDVGHPPLANSPKGNSSPAMLGDTNNQSLISQHDLGSTNRIATQIREQHSGTAVTSVYRALDGPLHCLPRNATEFRIPPPRGMYTDNNMAVLSSRSGTQVVQRQAQSDQITFQDIDDESLGQVHSSDAWLSPYPARPPLLLRSNPGSQVSQHSPARPQSLQRSKPGSQISQPHGKAHQTPTTSTGLSFSQSVRRQEALVRVSVMEILDQLPGSCVLCWYTGNIQSHLGVITCPLMQNTITTVWYRNLKNSLRFERFSCCFLCLVPFDICRGTGPARLRTCSGRYKDILLPLLLFLLKSPAERDRLAEYIGRENIVDDDSLKRWARPRVRWNGLECSNLWLLFVSLVQDLD